MTVAVRAVTSREVALRAILDVSGRDARGAQSAFDYRARQAALDPRDLAFAANLTYGAIKMRRTLDWYLRPYIGARAAQPPAPILELLRLGVYQLRYAGGVDDHAAVFETVALARRFGHRGTAGLVNAVLRRFIADAPAPPARDAFDHDTEWLAVVHSLPNWLSECIVRVFGERAADVFAGVNGPPQHALRLNGTGDSAAAIGALQSLGIAGERSTFAPESFVVRTGVARDDADGRWAVQSEASAMPVDVLDPRPGERIFDLCSGRGNKSAQIAARLHGRGSLTCVERDARKVARWKSAMAAQGLHAEIVHAGVEAFAPAVQADAVLLDAPCSGIGTIGRHAETRWRKSSDDGARLAITQGALLAAAARLVGPGGRLVYAVCSFDRREGREVVETFLRDTRGFARREAPERYRALASGQDILVPPGIEGRDGFWIASLQRTG